jgi:hypothetical protein
LGPWSTHAAGSVDAVSSKAILRTAICELDGNYRLNLETLPVAIVRRGKDVLCKATQDIEAGNLVVPLSFRKDASMIERVLEPHATIHPNAVNAVIGKPTTELEKLSGNENEETESCISVQPELKFPKPSVEGPTPSVEGKTPQWEQSDSVHPFWFIPRRKDKDEVTNCVMKQLQTIVIICATPEGSLKAIGMPFTSTFRLAIRCIVNTATIKADERVVAEWQLPAQKDKKTLKPRTWADDVANSERKRRKAEASV